MYHLCRRFYFLIFVNKLLLLFRPFLTGFNRLDFYNTLKINKNFEYKIQSSLLRQTARMDCRVQRPCNVKISKPFSPSCFYKLLQCRLSC